MKKILLVTLPLLLFLVSACDSATSSSAKASADAAQSAPLYTNISNAELTQLLERETTLVDIRRPEEWKQTGIVPGSRMITL
ncbi:MAG: rhodanese-like domain-containing protein, partial [Pseudomonadota bacterium]